MSERSLQSLVILLAGFLTAERSRQARAHSERPSERLTDAECVELDNTETRH